MAKTLAELQVELSEAESEFKDAELAYNMANGRQCIARNKLAAVQSEIDTYLSRLRDKTPGGKWAEDRRSRGFVAAGAFLLAVALTGCGSLAQVRLGAEPKMHPDEQVVFARICSGEENAARLYLESPTFAWIGPVKERYLTDALMKKLAGACPCPGKACPEGGAK